MPEPSDPIGTACPAARRSEPRPNSDQLYRSISFVTLALPLGGEFGSSKQLHSGPPDALAVDDGDGCRQRDILRTYLHAVLSVATVVDAAVAHHRVEPLGL